MRLRFKFSKNGLLKYVSHLDVMRYFQKVMRRCEVDVAFSGGFSPHMIMSFALPLGVGMTSDGEYFDLDVNSAPHAEKLLAKMNATQAEGFQILSVCRVPEEKAAKCMSVVAASDYLLGFDGPLPADFNEIIDGFLAQAAVEIVKKTKRHEELTDIRPWIYELRLQPDNRLYLLLSAGSVHHLKPELVWSSLCDYAKREDLPRISAVHRIDLYAGTRDAFVPLSSLGEEF